MATTSRLAEGLPKCHIKRHGEWHLGSQAPPNFSFSRGIGWTDGGIALISLGFGQSLKEQKGSILRCSKSIKEQANAGQAERQLGRRVYGRTTRADQPGGRLCSKNSIESKSLRRRETSLSVGASGSDPPSFDNSISGGGTSENFPAGRPHDAVTSREGLPRDNSNTISGRPQDDLNLPGGRPEVDLNSKGGRPQKQDSLTPVKKLAAAKDAASLPELDELEQIFDLKSNQEDQRTPLASRGNLEALGEPRLTLELLEELLSGSSNGDIEESELESENQKQGKDQRQPEANAPGLVRENRRPSTIGSVSETNGEVQDLENGVSSSEGWSHSALETALRTASSSFSDASRSQSSIAGAFESLIDPGAASLFVEDGRTERLPIEDVLGEGAAGRKAVWKAESVGQTERGTEKSRIFQPVDREKGERRREDSWQAEKVGSKEAKAVPGLWSEWLESVKTQESPSDSKKVESSGDLDSLRSVFEGPTDDEEMVWPSEGQGEFNDMSASGWSSDEDGDDVRQERRTGYASASQIGKASKSRGLVYEELSPSELFGEEPFEMIARKVETNGRLLGEENGFQQGAQVGVSGQGAVEALSALSKQSQNGSLPRSARALTNNSGRTNSGEEDGRPIRQERFGELRGGIESAESYRKYEQGGDSSEWRQERDANGLEADVAGSSRKVELSSVGLRENGRFERGRSRDTPASRQELAVRGEMEKGRLSSRSAESRDWRAPTLGDESETRQRSYLRESVSRSKYERGTPERGRISQLPEERYRPSRTRGPSDWDESGSAEGQQKERGREASDKERAWAAWQKFSEGKGSPQEMERFFSKWMQERDAEMGEPAVEARRVSRGRSMQETGNSIVLEAPRSAERNSSLEGPRVAGQRRDTGSQPIQFQRLGVNGPQRESVNEQEKGGVNGLQREDINELERWGVNRPQRDSERGGLKRPERNGLPERAWGVNAPEREGVNRPQRRDRDGVNEPQQRERDGVNGPQRVEREGVNGPRERGADVKAALLTGWGVEQGADPDWIGDGDQPEADTWQQEDEEDEDEFVQPNETEITKAFDRRRLMRQDETEPEEENGEEAPEGLSPLQLDELTEEQQKAQLLAQTLDLSLQNRQNSLKASRPRKKPREQTSMDERGFARFGEILPELERQKLLCQKVKSGKLVWAPCCVYYIIHHSHTEILRFFNARTRALARQWKLGYVATRALNYYMRSTCALTLAMKHELKSRAAAYRKWGRELTDPITRAKFDMRTPIPKGGWDSIDWDRPVGVRAEGGGYYTPEEMRTRSRMVPQPITWQVPTKEDPTMGGRWDLGIETPAAVKDRPRPKPRKQGRR